ncbi:MAG: thioredoxin domain-containing protein, partial [Deltaproteobacteria bacterium]|nr:thioredoxin domain-containing protein [Deltaproteobacteria bacterium]
AWTGNRDAKVAVVMFGDLECGYCKRSSAELARLEATYGDRVLFVFKHFPMDPACNPGVRNRKHRDACAAAKASVCAKEQGVFWSFHDLAYKNQHQLGAEYLRTYAVDAGADGARYDACLASDAPLEVVRHDAEVGASLDIHGTPRIFINGKLYRSGSSAEVMARAIEVALGASAEDAAKAAAAMHDAKEAVLPVPADVPVVRDVAFAALTFKIDTFEAAIVDGAAVSGRHNVPALRVTWYDAKAACEKAGKRLCTEAEWVSACQNARAEDDNKNGQFGDDMIEGTAYPYGDFHDDNRCWDDKEGEKFRPVYTGELPGCVTPTGVYDLTGNVEEWVGDSAEHAALMGGAFDTSEDHARCYRRNDTFGAGYAAPRTGFRCCSS